ncbi:MAG: hypothetical protein JXR32_03305 [Anaerolineaceae bacterium]|nr:hypothetical protein [Anaerolineaceae bacterium]
MKNWSMVIILGLFFLSACSGPAPDSEPAVPLPVVNLATEPPAVMPPTTTPLENGGLTLQSGGLTFTILSPADGATVTASPVELVVDSNVETVFTINGSLYVLAAGVESTFLVSLAEGYNDIELIASDYEGSQVEAILTVIYEK